jgi:uncharacterized membrane protein
MQLSGEFFSVGAIVAGAAVGGSALALAVRLAPWRRLHDNEQSHVFFGALVALLVLWVLRTEVAAGLVFHLSAMTALTLLFGWSLAVTGGALVLSGITLTGLADWPGLPINFVVEVLLPATLTQFLLMVVRSTLPKHFFIYIFVNAFLAGGVVGTLSAYFAATLLAGSGAYSWVEMQNDFFPFFPLMFFPEAFLNGWAMTLLVVFKPHWVGSFRDEEYLHGK